MVFSSTIFLFAFLPVVLIMHLLCGRALRNSVLFVSSLAFYTWGEGVYVFVMLFSITASWLFGVLLDRTTESSRRTHLLWMGVALNLLPLLYFKYASFIGIAFGLDEQSSMVKSLPTLEELPIGISFFTFQSLSYLIDVYRRTSEAQRSVLDLGLYIALFPQLIAGPIVRYKDVATQIRHRVVTGGDLAGGIERFVYGLGKKVLIANPLGLIADEIFGLDESSLSMTVAWLGVCCYALQIYFDFSGYSDMAIGLGRLFGFRFLENFNYPYISTSIQEFWRRWHISLSRWFRDYLYIPLGGNRVAPWRVAVNLLTVFFLCGLWHGASWNFIVWGLFHGGFLTLERGRFGRVLRQLPRLIQHSYVLTIVLIGWVFFRTDSFAHADYFLAAMFSSTWTSPFPADLQLLLDRQFYLALLMALVLSSPVFSLLRERLHSRLALSIVQPTLITAILIVSIFEIAIGSYNPFIYFRF